MSKEYRFCYHGTKEMLFHQCNQCRYVNEYIISTLGGKIEFGIERAGHSGGYWYTPNIIEYEDKIELVGKIQYIGPQSDIGYRSKLKDKIITVLLFIIFFPVVSVITVSGTSSIVSINSALIVNSFPFIRVTLIIAPPPFICIYAKRSTITGTVLKNRSG